MPRRLSRAAPVSPQASAATPKRRASARLSASEAQIKRAKSSSKLSEGHVKSTAKKSKYFEAESSDEAEAPSSDSAGDDTDSAYEGEEQGSGSSADQDSLPEDIPESEEETRKPRRKGKPARKIVSDEEALKGKELWREGVRTGLGPGKEVFIPKPKARDPGKTPYHDETLHPNTRLFLLDLAKNNDREWLKGRRPESQRGYRVC